MAPGAPLFARRGPPSCAAPATGETSESEPLADDSRRSLGAGGVGSHLTKPSRIARPLSALLNAYPCPLPLTILRPLPCARHPRCRSEGICLPALQEAEAGG